MRLSSWTLVPILAATLALGACGGGGGGSSGSSSFAGPAARNATVSVLLTDAPSTQWDQAIATITSVELIGSGGVVTLFSGSRTLDLLRLRDFSELFAVSDQVPAGSYSKIRLHVSNLVLNDLDAAGNVIDSRVVQLVGNGKIDLNPRGPFTLQGGDVLFVELDFDMDKSFKLTTTGGGRTILRPVVFVDIRTARPAGRLARIHGSITDINAADGSLRLCQSRFASAYPLLPLQDAGRNGDHDFDARHCVTVRTDALTGVFDSDGLPQDLAGLAVGEEATAIGRLRPLDATRQGRRDDDFGHDRQPLALDAVIIEEGPLGTFRRIGGTVNAAADPATQVFDLAVAPGQGFSTGTVLPVQLFDASRVFNRRGEELHAADIQPGIAALADGVLHLGAATVLRSPLVILDAGPVPAATKLEGSVVSVDVAHQSLRINDGSADRCVDAAQAQVFAVSAGDGFSSTRIELGSLRSGQGIVAFGVERLDGCFVADTLIADAG